MHKVQHARENDASPVCSFVRRFPCALHFTRDVYIYKYLFLCKVRFFSDIVEISSSDATVQKKKKKKDLRKVSAVYC